jgi:DNA-binding NtrC family response regulator
MSLSQHTRGASGRFRSEAEADAPAHHATRILIVDDDPLVAESLAELLNGEGHETATAGDGAEALTMLEAAAAGEGRRRPFGIVIADLNLPRLDGMELLRRLRDQHAAVVPIVIAGFAKIESAVEAVKLGAADYLTKPIVDDELRLAVSKAANQHALLAENAALKSQLTERYGIGSLVGADYRMQKVYDLIEAVAETPTTVLITGESGTGKTMVARAVHTLSNRGNGPFVTVSCGSIPETLLESELFGHKKGAFTGAAYDKAGKILAADGGTLFIDEINSAPPALQVKLLRVLQEKAFEPVGSEQTQQVDVRFVLASNERLAELVEAGQFREDLYYRINVVDVNIPPLRQRVGDIPLLAEHFLEKYTQQMGRDRMLGEEARAGLQAYHWPGNVRELENAIERAVVLSRGPSIQLADLPEPVRAAREGGSAGGPGQASGGGQVQVPALVGGWSPTPLHQALREPERQILLTALQANAWNRQTTAAQLQINRTTLYKKIKHHRLDEPTA